MGVVTSHAVAAHSQYGGDASKRLQDVMEAAILQANQEGISNAEENSPVIRQRIREAYHKELAQIAKEEHAKKVIEAHETYRMRRDELDRAHDEHLTNMAKAHYEEITSIHASVKGD